MDKPEQLDSIYSLKFYSQLILRFYSQSYFENCPWTKIASRHLS